MTLEMSISGKVPRLRRYNILEVSISKRSVRLSVFHVHVDIILSKCPLVRKSICLFVSLSVCVNALNE